MSVPSWWDRATCKGQPTELFFPVLRESNKEALAFCRVCPVKLQCREWALRHELHGTWGGLSERQRKLQRQALHIPCTTPKSLIGVKGRPT
jgi:WhiB family redox-sensing transcriptional regulator